MSVAVVVPSALRELTHGRGRVELGGGIRTVRDAFASLQRKEPAIYDRVITETGDVRTHINVFVGCDNIRYADGLETKVPEGAEVIILPAVSGG